MLSRKDLVSKLERVAPALAGNDLVPVLSHFAFRGDEVVAHNDQIAISVPCKTDFEGCIQGKTFLELMNASKALQIEFDDKPEELVVIAASSRMTLPMFPLAQFDEIFTLPEQRKRDELPVDTKAFLAAIDCCMRSVSLDTSVPDQLGVTMIVDGKDLLLFSTDNATMSHAVVKLKGKPDWKRAILSAAFCKEMLSLADKAKALHLEIHTDKGYSMLVNTTSTLWGKLIESSKPVSFIDTFEDMCPADANKIMVEIPKKLQGIVERACIISAINVESVRTQITVSNGGKAKFRTTTKRGSVTDTLGMDGKHYNVELAVDPKLLKRGWGAFERMLITKRCFIMATKSTYYLVGT